MHNMHMRMCMHRHNGHVRSNLHRNEIIEVSKGNKVERNNFATHTQNSRGDETRKVARWTSVVVVLVVVASCLRRRATY